MKKSLVLIHPDSDKIANIYFTGGVDARNRVRDLNEYNKINLNEMRRKTCLMTEFSILVKTVNMMWTMMLSQSNDSQFY